MRNLLPSVNASDTKSRLQRWFAASGTPIGLRVPKARLRPPLRRTCSFSSKQLRNRFEIRGWQDVYDTIGDAFADSLNHIRYCIPNADANRSRWPTHELWRRFANVIGTRLSENRSGVIPSNVIYANRIAKMRELDTLLSGLFITRAAISDVAANEFEEFMERHVDTLMLLVGEHSVTLNERIAKARGRYRLD